MLSGGGLVVLAAGEQRPDDARVLRREGDCRDIVRAAPAQALRPAALGIAALRGHAQHRAGAVNEQGAQVHIAVLGHGAESLLAAGGMLPRREPEPSGELATVVEHLGVAHAGDQRRRGDRAYALDLHQPLRRFARPRQRRDAPIVGGDARIEFAQLSSGVSEHFAGDAGKSVGAVLQNLRQRAAQAVEPDRRRPRHTR